MGTSGSIAVVIRVPEQNIVVFVPIEIGAINIDVEHVLNKIVSQLEPFRFTGSQVLT